MLVRESISFERGADPKKILGIGSASPGDVYKYHWPWEETHYVMILEEKNIIENYQIYYLTTKLGTYDERYHKWAVPYAKNSIYYPSGEKQGSQRAGFWPTEKYNEYDDVLIPINENDIKKLIRYFSKPRNLSYLQEIKEEEGVVPYFLEHLLTNI
jgi:hypothetical protein